MRLLSSIVLVVFVCSLVLLFFSSFFFFFNDTATTEIYTLSLHDALPIFHNLDIFAPHHLAPVGFHLLPAELSGARRSEEHTSELQSRQYLVCRLLLEKKKTKKRITNKRRDNCIYDSHLSRPTRNHTIVTK